MKKDDYRKYTEFYLEPAGMRRLNFIVKGSLDYMIKNNLESKDVSIMDVGCGNGNISLPLASLGFNVLGLDIDKNSIEYAHKKNIFSNATFKKKRMEDVHDKFDLIVANEILEHIEDPWSFLKELRNKLKPNGLLFISIPNGKSPEERIRKFLNHSNIGIKMKKTLRKTVLKQETVQTMADSPHLHFFSWREFKQLLDGAEIEIIKRKNVSILFKGLFYMGGRIFIKRGKWPFIFFNMLDDKFSNVMPLFTGDSWMIQCKKSKS